MIITPARALFVAAILLPLAADSCAPATSDRPAEAGGRTADQTSDTRHVTVYRSPDDVPNVVTMCVGKYGFITTLSGTDAAENKGAVIVRFPEIDATCA
jgi:hypothetical protein